MKPARMLSKLARHRMPPVGIDEWKLMVLHARSMLRLGQPGVIRSRSLRPTSHTRTGNLAIAAASPSVAVDIIPR